ncbi:MAG: hypothetical protein HYT37_04100 [Candidatus Sungbacteria bacterium]|nr:hypothetical protein [Candidatus Sungbacteria bacterium]
MEDNFQQSKSQTKPPLLQRPWFQGASAFILSIPAGMIITQIGGLILSPASFLEDFFLQISLLLVANTLLLIPIIFVAPFFALAGTIVALVVARKYPKNLFRNMLIVGTIIVVIIDIIFLS